MPAGACSRVASSFQPQQGLDGRVHWPSYSYAMEQQPIDWITVVGDATVAETLVPPKLLEGRAYPLEVISSVGVWWVVNCDGWNPPRTVACASYVMTDFEGRPLARVGKPLTESSNSTFGTLFSTGDEVLSLQLLSPLRMTKPSRLRLQRARVEPWSDLGQANPHLQRDRERWRKRYNLEPIGDPSWETLWETELPLERLQASSGRSIHSRVWQQLKWDLDDDRLALVAAIDEKVLVAVYDVSNSKTDPLTARYERIFPRAYHGLATDGEGQLALASPSSIDLSSNGELALGHWSLNPDCTYDRPNGFVVLDPSGRVLADVLLEEQSEGLAFDADDTLVVSTVSTLARFSVDGSRLGEIDPVPRSIAERNEERRRRIDALTVDSSVDEWIEYGSWGGRHATISLDEVLLDRFPEASLELPVPLWIEIGAKSLRAIPAQRTSGPAGKVRWLAMGPEARAPPCPGLLLRNRPRVGGRVCPTAQRRSGAQSVHWRHGAARLV